MKKNKIGHNDALIMAGRIASAIGVHCHRLQIAGSVRRGKANVSDIEFLIIPKPSLWTLLEDWKQKGYIRPRLNKRGAQIAWKGFKQRCIEAWDTRLKIWIPVDLFFTDQYRWACSLLIRTGDADFSRLFVTRADAGGMLPAHLTYKDWLLWNADGKALWLRSEADAFKAIGRDFILPYNRTAKAVTKKPIKIPIEGSYSDDCVYIPSKTLTSDGKGRGQMVDIYIPYGMKHVINRAERILSREQIQS